MMIVALVDRVGKMKLEITFQTRTRGANHTIRRSAHLSALLNAQVLEDDIVRFNQNLHLAGRGKHLSIESLAWTLHRALSGRR